MRARLWVEVLNERLGAQGEPVTFDPGSARAQSGVKVTSPQAGALPLLLLERQVDELPLVDICVVEPGLVTEGQPYCGCDACDDGSAMLLEQIDDAVAAVVGGPYVVLRGPAWVTHWYPEGASGSGMPDGFDFDHAVQLSRRLSAFPDSPVPPGVEAFVGRSWLA